MTGMVIGILPSRMTVERMPLSFLITLCLTCAEWMYNDAVMFSDPQNEHSSSLILLKSLTFNDRAGENTSLGETQLRSSSFLPLPPSNLQAHFCLLYAVIN